MTSDDTVYRGVRLLLTVGCHAVRHSRRTLLHHLISTYQLLRGWGGSESLCLAGLFHSVYGTDSFRFPTSGRVTREMVRDIIGSDAERIAWLFGMSTSKSLWSAVCSNCNLEPNRMRDIVLVNRVSNEEMSCAPSDLMLLMNLELANALDQARRLPELYGEAKRKALGSLLVLALPGATETFKKVFGTIHISQPRGGH